MGGKGPAGSLGGGGIPCRNDSTQQSRGGLLCSNDNQAVAADVLQYCRTFLRAEQVGLLQAALRHKAAVLPASAAWRLCQLAVIQPVLKLAR